MDINPTKKQNPNILLVNFHSACNTGDAALFEAAIVQLRSSFVEPHIMVSTNYPDESYLHSFDVQVIQSFGSLIGLHKKPAGQQLLRAIIGFTMCGLAVSFSRAGRKMASWFPDGWQEFVEAYSQADLVINCPGNQFFTMGTFGWPLIISSASIFCAYVFKKPVYVLPSIYRTFVT